MTSPAEAASAHPPPEELIELLLGSAGTYLDRGESELALRCASHALGLARSAPGPAGVTRALRVMGRIRASAGEWQEARANLEECHQLQAESGDYTGAASTFCELGEILTRAGDYPEARSHLMESLRLSSGSSPGAIRARALEGLGSIERLLGDPERAVQSFQEALRIHEALGDRAGEARDLNRLGNTYQKMGLLEQALAHQQRAMAIWETLGERLELGKCFNNIGTTFLEQGDYASASECFERACAAFKEFGERAMLAHVLSNMGLLWDYRGETGRAEEYLKESLAIREELVDRVGQANCLNNLSNLAHLMGRYEEAIEHARRSIDIRQELRQRDGLAKPWFNLAQSLIELGRIDEAERAAGEVRGIADGSSNLETQSEALLLDAAIALRKGQPSVALAAAEQALERSASGGHRRQAALAHHYSGEAAVALGDLDRAREELLSAEGIFRELKAHPYLALCRLSLGLMFLRAGAREAAAERLRRAAETFQLIGNLSHRWQCLMALAEAELPRAREQARATLGAAADLARSAGRADLAVRSDARLAELSLSETEPPPLPESGGVLIDLCRGLRELRTAEAVCSKAMALLVDRCALLACEVRLEGRDCPSIGPYPAGGRIPEIASDLAAAALAKGKSRCVEMTEPERGRVILAAIPIEGLAGGPLGVLILVSKVSLAGDESDDPPAWLAIAEACASVIGCALRGPDQIPAIGADAALEARTKFEGLVGASPSMRRLFREIAQIAPSDASALIQGESGTGKELVAKAIHNLSKRVGPFVAISCPSIPRELFESELFGHERGAFTGAHTSRPGMIERADRGTLFLDEIGDIAPAVQSKLLRFLQEREFQRVGGRTTIRVDVRIVAATSRDLEQETREGRFREDLFYRLSVVPLELPPLRARSVDILHLAAHFLEELAKRHEASAPIIGPDAAAILRRYPWPGNVRELRNVLEYMFTIDPGKPITSSSIPEKIRIAAQEARPEEDTPGAPLDAQLLRPGETLDTRLFGFEGELIRSALERCDWNQSLAAKLLGIPETRIRHRMKRYGIANPGGQSAQAKGHVPGRIRGRRSS